MRRATMLHIWTLRVIAALYAWYALLNLTIGSDGGIVVLFPLQTVLAWMAFQAAAFLSEVISS